MWTPLKFKNEAAPKKARLLEMLQAPAVVAPVLVPPVIVPAPVVVPAIVVPDIVVSAIVEPPAPTLDDKGKLVDDKGRRLQKRVNEKKNKEDERKKAADLLDANAGKFAVTLEDVEEPSDAAEEVEDETWDVARRLQLAEAAWAAHKPNSGAPTQAAVALDSPAFDPAVAPLHLQAGRTQFSLLASFFDTATGGPAPTLCAVANVVRHVLHHSSEREADVSALLVVLLAGQRKVLNRLLVEAVSSAFGLRVAPMHSQSPDKLADTALAARLKQRVLFQGRRNTVADVASLLEEFHILQQEAVTTSGVWQKVYGHFKAERLTKLVGSSLAENRETWHLVRVLQGHMGFSWDVVLRGFAHAMVLFAPRRWPDDRSRAEAMVAMEDAMLRAYSQDGGRTGNLVKAVIAGTTPEALIAACPPTCGVAVSPMRAEAVKDVAVALQKLGQSTVLAEWLLMGERAQLHVQDDGKRITVFNTRMGTRAERVEDSTAILAGNLAEVDSCILDVIFMRPIQKKPAKPEKGTPAALKEPLEKKEEPLPVPEQDKEQEHEHEKDKEHGKSILGSTMIVLDLIMLNGVSLTQRSLRERRAELSKVLRQHTRLRLPRGSEISAQELSAEAVAAKLDEALSASFLVKEDEKVYSRAMGLVLKRLDGPESTYFAGRPFPSWQALEKPPANGSEADRLLLEVLTEEERRLVPPVEEFHFTVVSGFRTRTVEGITDILRIQQLYNDAGVVPTWYVDNECPEEYRKLGLKVVKAGKLIPARNHALEDAFRDGKICVQTSDDIGCWQFFNDDVRYNTDEEANAAWKRAEKFNVSPVAAARFLTAKMRARGHDKCKLGGVYPLSNGGRAMRARAICLYNFVLGDFFVAEVSECRFDERLSLKEDYDFTASHLERYGEALRCNRLIITAKHETNAGGACDVRDAEGKKERYNIGVLKDKWPGAIYDHPTRANQIVLRWKSLKKNRVNRRSEGHRE